MTFTARAQSLSGPSRMPDAFSQMVPNSILWMTWPCSRTLGSRMRFPCWCATTQHDIFSPWILTPSSTVESRGKAAYTTAWLCCIPFPLPCPHHSSWELFLSQGQCWSCIPQSAVCCLWSPKRVLSLGSFHVVEDVSGDHFLFTLGDTSPP